MHCDCEFCKLNFSIQLPKDLIDSLLCGEVVIFAGAGISTESRRVFKSTFMEDVQAGLTGTSASSFPEVMQELVDQPDGRLKLLRKIKARFENIDSFPELNRTATRFHRELGTLFPVREIVTTNWDTYFERYCFATPFVADSDLAMWSAAKRKVLKIHGSIESLGSIVATTADYQECATRLATGIIGGLLKTILATRTVVFIGYSLQDSDFQQVYGFVKDQMRGLGRQAYVVTPFEADAKKFESDGLIALQTDGTFFLVQLKRHLENMGVLLSDEVFDKAAELRTQVEFEHAKLHHAIKLTRIPELIYAASYQDGLAHALDRSVRMSGSGEYSHPCQVQGVANLYVDLIKEKRSQGRYEDVAYIEGYLNGLVFLLTSNDSNIRAKPPLYFAFGVDGDISTLRKWRSIFAKGRVPHKAARKRAIQAIAKLSNPDGIEFHHPPWL